MGQRGTAILNLINDQMVTAEGRILFWRSPSFSISFVLSIAWQTFLEGKTEIISGLTSIYIFGWYSILRVCMCYSEIDVCIIDICSRTFLWCFLRVVISLILLDLEFIWYNVSINHEDLTRHWWALPSDTHSQI